MTAGLSLPSDRLMFDANALRSLAPAAVVRDGIAYADEHRVTKLSCEGEELRAEVQGSRTYDVCVVPAGRTGARATCSCGSGSGAVCKHAVAALVAHASARDEDETVVVPGRDEAIAARRRRGRREVVVARLDDEAAPYRRRPALGMWRARSLRARWGLVARSYTVALNALEGPVNHCSCPDFATNRLGTCKHVEAALHRHQARPARRRRRSQPAPSVIYLDWTRRPAPTIAIRRGAGPDASWVRAAFDERGRLRPGRVDDVVAFAKDSARVEGVVINPDVVDYLASERATRAQCAIGQALAETIRRSDGRVSGINARLHPYQVDGAAFLVEAGRAVLADDMGLGKTLQAITACRVLLAHGEAQRVLVVCPASLKVQWAKEIRRFTGLEATIVQGNAPTRLALYRRLSAFTIVNYELVLRDVDVIEAALAPDVLVADEVQRIKNWRTKTAAALKSLSVRRVFGLSGTPLENRLEDIFGVFQLVAPRVLGPRWSFMNDFHVLTKQGEVLGHRNLAELRQRLAAVLLRRDRTVIRHLLPPRFLCWRMVELSPRQRALHNEAVARVARLAQLRLKRPLTPAEQNAFIATLQKARMACNAAGLVDKETVGAPKLDALRELLTEYCVGSGRKVVVFSQWRRMTDMAEEVVRSLGLELVHLHGGVASGSRGALIDRFREDRKCAVFLSTDAGGVGLNLQSASVLINLDLPWNPAVLDQRIARIHRLGQQEAATIVLLVAAHSYEAEIRELLKTKRRLFRNVVTDGDEDAVGLNEAMVNAVIAAQAEPPPSAERIGDEVQLLEPVARKEAPKQPGVVKTRVRNTESLDAVVAYLHEALGEALGSIVVAGRGLIAVTKTVVAPIDWPDDLRGRAKVVVLDARTYGSLRELSADGLSVIGELPTPQEAGVGDLQQQAIACIAEAALAASAGDLAGALAQISAALEAAIHPVMPGDETPTDAGLTDWLFTEAVPNRFISHDDAMTILRARVFAAAPEVSQQQTDELLTDARALLQRLTLLGQTASRGDEHPWERESAFALDVSAQS